MPQDSRDWPLADDLLLITALTRNLSLQTIANTVRFSVAYNPLQLQERWRQLLYNEDAARSVARAAAAHKDTTKKTKWDEKEENLLMSEALSSSFVSFRDTLARHRDVFHPTRTPRSLEVHFQRLRDLGREILSKSSRKREALVESSFAEIEAELMKAMHRLDAIRFGRAAYHGKEKQINDLEHRLGLVPGPNDPAVIKGLAINYATVIGRKTKTFTPDVDLSEEDPEYSKGISRKQTKSEEIDTASTAEYHVENVGRKSMLVNGMPLIPGQRTILPCRSVLQFGEIGVIFEAPDNVGSKSKPFVQELVNQYTTRTQTTVQGRSKSVRFKTPEVVPATASVVMENVPNPSDNIKVEENALMPVIATEGVEESSKNDEEFNVNDFSFDAAYLTTGSGSSGSGSDPEIENDNDNTDDDDGDYDDDVIEEISAHVQPNPESDGLQPPNNVTVPPSNAISNDNGSETVD